MLNVGLSPGNSQPYGMMIRLAPMISTSSRSNMRSSPAS
jgi:hypothetical protein